MLRRRPMSGRWRIRRSHQLSTTWWLAVFGCRRFGSVRPLAPKRPAPPARALPTCPRALDLTSRFAFWHVVPAYPTDLPTRQEHVQIVRDYIWCAAAVVTGESDSGQHWHSNHAGNRTPKLQIIQVHRQRSRSSHHFPTPTDRAFRIDGTDLPRIQTFARIDALGKKLDSFRQRHDFPLQINPYRR